MNTTQASERANDHRLGKSESFICIFRRRPSGDRFSSIPLLCIIDRCAQTMSSLIKWKMIVQDAEGNKLYEQFEIAFVEKFQLPPSASPRDAFR